MIDREKFFAGVRAPVFGGSMQQVQVDGCETILAEWEKRNLKDMRWLAYMLATTYHETAHTMQPINEGGGAAYFNRMYGVEGDNPERARKNGNVNAGDGARYHGRGYVQLTWRNNYQRMGELLKQPLEAQPELALVPANAAAIMFEGMTKGLFTGKSLPLYFNEHGADWVNARRIINGLDCAQKIADYGTAFFMALKDDGAKPAPKPIPEPPKIEIPQPGKPGAQPDLAPTFWGRVADLFKPKG